VRIACKTILFAALAVGPYRRTASAQVLLDPGQLDQLVSRIALYPDALLAQVLTASTYPEQIPNAAQWADQHSYLAGDSLAAAINQDNLPWDPSVLALLPFPSVLDMMAGNIQWTRQFGDAVLGQRGDVMDAVQRMRQTAFDNGNLRTGPQYSVVAQGPGSIQIVPVIPMVYFVPAYDPFAVFVRPAAGVAVGITFGPRIVVGNAFAPWGWGRSSLSWTTRTIVIDGHPWARTHENRAVYSHPYAVPHPPPGPRIERHELKPPPGHRESRSENLR